MKIRRRRIEPVLIDTDRPELEKEKIKYKPTLKKIRKEDKNMLQKIIKVVRDAALGLIGGGAGFALTGDVTTALALAVVILALALGVDFELIKKAYRLIYSEKK